MFSVQSLAAQSLVSAAVRFPTVLDPLCGLVPRARAVAVAARAYVFFGWASVYRTEEAWIETALGFDDEIAQLQNWLLGSARVSELRLSRRVAVIRVKGNGQIGFVMFVNGGPRILLVAWIGSHRYTGVWVRMVGCYLSFNRCLLLRANV